ncbi:MAG TPA: succinylglutamate desuccinylase/aspartoacylase family protein, partial [Armatimonadota bacterium]|nr:succinylglutamate desuccinylase/aspartoacylase family protein [Armatimonadota bacterium]
GKTDRKVVTIEDPESGQPISIPVVVARGVDDGPTLCLLAAQHGTEINGSAAIHLLLQHLDASTLAGSVIAIPVANPPATRTRQQAFPTDAGWGHDCPHNMNHAWPGDAEGTLTERMTAVLWDQCIEASHAVIDFHAHAIQYGAKTTTRATSDASLAVAKALGVAHILTPRETSDPALYDVAAKQGKAALEVQLPPRGTIWPASVRVALSGLRNAMAHLLMIDREERPTETAVVVPESETKDWKTPTDGMVIGHVDPGSIVQEGALIAEVVSLHTAEAASEAVAPYRGVATMIGRPARELNAPDTDVVTQGEVYARIVRCDL